MNWGDWWRLFREASRHRAFWEMGARRVCSRAYWTAPRTLTTLAISLALGPVLTAVLTAGGLYHPLLKLVLSVPLTLYLCFLLFPLGTFDEDVD
jgi:hypothetical protein